MEELLCYTKMNGGYAQRNRKLNSNLAKECDCMIWGYDYSARLIVDIVILVVILSVHFLRRYIKRKKHQNEDEITKNQTEK